MRREPAFGQLDRRQLALLDEARRLGDGEEIGDHRYFSGNATVCAGSAHRPSAACAPKPAICLDILDRGGDPVALRFRHIEPQPGQRRIEFLSGHGHPRHCERSEAISIRVGHLRTRLLRRAAPRNDARVLRHRPFAPWPPSAGCRLRRAGAGSRTGASGRRSADASWRSGCRPRARRSCRPSTSARRGSAGSRSRAATSHRRRWRAARRLLPESCRPR